MRNRIKKQLDFIPQPLRLWVPPLVVIATMLFLGYESELAQYFLFGHHLFWFLSIILLINPMTETFWSGNPRKGKRFASDRSTSRAQPWSKPGRHKVKHRPSPASEPPAERLARLQLQKGGVDREIEQLQTRSQGPVKQKNG